jgi:hypothetical protein
MAEGRGKDKAERQLGEKRKDQTERQGEGKK